MGIFHKKDKIDKTNKSLWYCLETNFKNLDGHEFEQIIARLYRKKGFRVEQTPKGADQGVDLIARGNLLYSKVKVNQKYIETNKMIKNSH